VNLNNIKNFVELIDIFFSEKIGNTTVPNSKKIFVIEDIDCSNDVIYNRKQEYSDQNDQKNKPNLFDKISTLTLSDLLYCFDGLIELKDCIIIMTTNYIEKLDEALIRPGRINMKIELKSMKGEHVKEMLQYYYKGESIEKKYIKDYYITPAALENICLQHEKIDGVYKALDKIIE
jgi:chaperone BCS1